ncbi:hypothetical protein L249_3598 [Ophiocordyceps polyrhachis-furcata BCC 54312]|uniref:Vacuolar membrane protein n=1 Tax=Ophiocordyceps polyrhachis-furcata BCC 54312 TaxID=1330021 RepID=A0A367LM24_9HYPO|nr:hypothetical protein L249_3598 [Ophiocordyceps polyrhachis-furcata BCC 54312]
MHPPPAAGLVQDAITKSTTPTPISLTTATASAAATAIASLASSPSNIMSSSSTTTTTTTQSQESQQGECRLLGSFALLVQAALGALALLSLVYKRWRERPQRPVKIWFFDVSKQVFGSVLVHVANIFMSMLTSGRFNIIRPEPAVAATQRLMMMMRSVGQDSESSYAPNPCSFYLLNLAIDTTVGIPILIVLLRILTGLATMTPLGKPAESILSGNYGSPPNAWWWLKQSIIYFGGLFGMKLCVLIIFVIFPWISKVGDWALGWTEGNERLQIAFVMMIFPLVMNALQYYIIDSFIKKKEPDHHDRLSTDDPDEPSRPYDESTRLRAHRNSSSEDDDDDDHHHHHHHHHQRDQHVRARSSRDYDPEVDGHAPTVVGSGSSRIKVAPTELFPKE